MKIKKGLTVCSSDFWYDISTGGYIKPEEILVDPNEVKKVQEAVKVLMQFEKDCKEQIEDFEM